MASYEDHEEIRPIDAILLVGGKGTRLRPLTVSTPKPMLPTAGVPFVVHQLARAREAGVDHVVLATSYRPEVFERHLGDGASLGLHVDYVSEAEPLGTGGGIRNVAGRLCARGDEPVLILNGDVLSGHDIGAQLNLHRSSGAAVTLHLTRAPDPRPFGCVPTDGQSRVVAFHEKDPNPVTDQINAGCYVFSRDVIDAIPAGRVVSVERETFPDLLAAGAVVMGYVDASYWLDIGTPAAFVQASRDIVTGTLHSAALPGEPGPRLLLPGASVDPSAQIVGGSCIGDGARVGAGAVVDGSVVFDGAVVAAAAVVRDSVIGAGAHVGEGAILDGAVIGDRARVGAGNELRGGLRLWPDADLTPLMIRFSSDAAPS